MISARLRISGRKFEPLLPLKSFWLGATSTSLPMPQQVIPGIN